MTTPQTPVAALTDDEAMALIQQAFGYCNPANMPPERMKLVRLVESATTPAPAGQIDALRELFALHAAEVENNPYAYCEVAYTRATGWMAWITDKPLACVVESPDRKVLLRGQGDTPEEAAAAALRAARGDEVNQK